jgi:outer membrane receptor protein involved in Fe transport
MKEITFINDLKVRAGYGLAGNQDGIDSYTTLSLVQPNGVVPVGTSAMVSLSEFRNTNPNLKWEVKRTFNAGFDITMLDNRLLLSANYYNSKTNDMLYLYNVGVPPFAYSELLANIGSMRNDGAEISIGFTPLRTADMELNINANLTFQRNKLLSLSGTYEGQGISAPAYKSLASLNGAGFHGGYNHIVYQIVGQPLGVFYLPHCTGLKSDGAGGYTYNVADLNGNGVNLEDGEDRYVAGQAVPKRLLGSNISFRYKRVDIAVQMNGAFGHKIYNGTSLTYMNMNSFPEYNVMAKAPKQNIKDQTATDYWLEKGDYLNFDYVTVGWNVPTGKAAKYLRSLRLSLTVNNLATICSYSGLTPMINSSTVNSTLGVDDKRSYPLARTYTMGLSVNF